MRARFVILVYFANTILASLNILEACLAEMGKTAPATSFMTEFLAFI
jgi:hypothetical protein